MKRSSKPITFAIASSFAALAWSSVALAQSEGAAPTLQPVRADVAAQPSVADDRPAVVDRASGADEVHKLRIGAIAGVGFPRPLAIEPMVVVGGWVAFGAEYGVMPAMTIYGVDTSLWSLAGDVRVFPFRGNFFVGLKLGHQHIDASTTVTVAPYGSAPEQLALDSFYINPRIGFVWTSNAGLTLGVEAGVQVPLTASIDSSLPFSLAPASVQNTVQALGGAVLPTVDLLRIGLLL
ncbi:MAG TPA: hypothetical protein VGM06_26165 [Polyangiaceae bacterium]|jgi:hypothetical protein